MHALHQDWHHPAPYRDPFSRIAAGIATLLLYLPLFLLALTHQGVAIIVLTLAVMQAERLAAPRLQTNAQGLTLAQAN